MARRATRLDTVLVVLVLALALLLGLTAARSSVVWLHLATGRAIATGACRLGDDPFTIDGTFGAAHTWLSDLLAYGAYRLAGGPGIVLGKTLLVVLLALVLVRLGRQGEQWGLPAAGACLSLVALGPRLEPRPVVFSYLFLPLTLWLLQRRSALPRAGGRLRGYAPVLVLFVLWGSLDDWFLLGPLAVLLYAAGEGIAFLAGRNRGERLAGLGLLAALGLAVGLLNPAGLHALSLPPELGLSAASASLREDPTLQSIFLSPFQEEYRHSGQLWGPSGACYLALVALGGLSFLAGRRGLSDWRLPVWLAFFLLSAWNIQAIPFFAVVAGPVLALNAHDLLGRLEGGSTQERPEDPWARAGRALALPLMLLLMIAAWPGWLQAPPYEMRRWDVVRSADMERAGDQLRAWSAEHNLGEGRGMLYSTEVANYLAWLCPTEKGWVNSRLRAPADLAEDFVAVRRGIQPPREGDEGPAWREVLRCRGVNHLVALDTDRQRLALAPLLAQPEEWPLLRTDDQVLFFGWNDPERPADRLSAPPLDFNQLAFAPDAGDRAPLEASAGSVEPWSWWQPFYSRRPDPSPDRGRAALYLLLFQLQQPSWLQANLRGWMASTAATVVGSAADPSAAGLSRYLIGANILVRLGSHNSPLIVPAGTPPPLDPVGEWLTGEHLFQQSDGPPGLLLLAVRAARRDLRENPADAHTYFVLGQAYLQLAQGTRERLWVARYRMTEWRRIREVQAITALQRAVRLQPDLLEAHQALASVYERMGHPDLALNHYRRLLQLLRDRSAQPDTAPAQQRQVLALEKRVERMEDRVEKLRNRYELAAANRKLLDRVHAALELGLAETALELLLAADVVASGQPALQLQMGLMLTAGRAEEVRAWLEPSLEDFLGTRPYRTIHLEAALACGDYAKADDHVTALAAQFEQPVSILDRSLAPRQAMSVLVAKGLLEGHLKYENPGHLLAEGLNETWEQGVLRQLQEPLQRKADLEVLRGLLLLEQGDVGTARQQLSSALSLWGSPAHAASGAGLDFTRRPLAEELGQWLSGKAPRLPPLSPPGERGIRVAPLSRG